MVQPRHPTEEPNARKASELLASARRQRDNLIRETEVQLIKLALNVAIDMIGQELDQKRDEISQIVGNALETIRQQRDIIVRVHPQDIKDLSLGRRSHDDWPGVREGLMYVHKLAAQGFRSIEPQSTSSEIPGMDITPDNLRRAKGEAGGVDNLHINEQVGSAGEARRTSPEEAETVERKAYSRMAEVCVNAQKEVEDALEEGLLPSIEPQVFEAAALLAETRALRDKLIRETEPLLIKLALKVAVKTIGHALEHNEEEIAQAVARAIDTVRRKRYLTIRLHPVTLQSLTTTKSQQQSRLQHHEEIELVPDETIDSGVCRVITDVGMIDAPLDTVFEPLLETLLGESSSR